MTTRPANIPALPADVDRNVRRAIEELKASVQSLREKADALHTEALASRSRASHTGTQAISTINGLTEALAEKSTTSVDDLSAHTRTPHLTADQITDLTDAGDSELHYHATDRNRLNHTGEQAINTVTGLQAALDGKEPANANIQAHVSSAHLTADQITDLTDGGFTTLHSHSGLLPAAHATAHVTGGADVIPNAVAGGNSGLMSGADKTKLDGVATGANNYTHPANHPPSIITQDASNRFVTDTEKSTWNGKASGTHASNHVTGGSDVIANAVAGGNAGLMTGTDKTKLDGIDTGANNYVHPANHAPSIITQDASNRFVTDAEKTTWNSKEPANANIQAHIASSHLTAVQVTDLTDSGDSTLHYHAADRDRANHTGSQAIATVTGLQTALDGKEPANANIQTHISSAHLSSTNITDLTDGGDSTLHYHAADRDRTNHTGAQAISTITNLQTSLDTLTTMISELTADLALTTALVRTKVATYAATTSPAMAYIGDLWFDTANAPNKYRLEDRSAGVNPITNPGFESGLWTEEYSAGNGSASLVTGWNGTGSAMRVTVTVASNIYGRVSSRNITLNAGDYAHLSFRVRANRRLNLNYCYLLNSGVGNLLLPTVVATTTWQPVVISVYVPSGRTSSVYGVMVALRSGVSGVVQNDWVEVDDLVLTPGVWIAR